MKDGATVLLSAAEYLIAVTPGDAGDADAVALLVNLAFSMLRRAA